MNEQGTVENLVYLVQSEVKSKTFRINYPVTEELRQEMVFKVFRDFMVYALNQYYDEENLTLLEEFVDEHQPKQEKKERLLDNLFWWRIMYDAGQNIMESCMEEYLSDNRIRFRNRPFITSWLRQCDKAVPKFYFIGHKYNDHVFVAIDILTEEPLDVMVFDATAVPPKQGEIAIGILIPLGGGLYFPIVDFYHFDYQAREAMASCLHYHYEKNLKTSNMHEAFLHVLSVMLQIERIIFMEEQEKLTTKKFPIHK